MGGEEMGFLDRLKGIRDRREDLDCPANVNKRKLEALYGSGSPMASGSMVKIDPTHRVCRKCTRRFNITCR